MRLNQSNFPFGKATQPKSNSGLGYITLAITLISMLSLVNKYRINKNAYNP